MCVLILKLIIISLTLYGLYKMENYDDENTRNA